MTNFFYNNLVTTLDPNYRKTELLESRLDEGRVLRQDGLQVAASVLDVAKNWKKTRSRIRKDRRLYILLGL